MERSERRGSLGRALEKLKTAMRRKGSSSKDPPTLANISTVPQPSSIPREGTESTTSGPPAHVEATGAATSSRPSTPSDPTPLVADDGTTAEADDTDEPLLPMLSSRAGISEDKARLLFEKYGVAYQPRRRSNEQEPPSKVRRVEKAVRIRVHWECHQCQSHFARDRSCLSCGHYRCTECRRTPAKRVREIMESTKQAKEQTEQQEQQEKQEQQQSGSHQPSATIAAPMAGETLDKSTTATAPDVTANQPLETDDSAAEDDAALEPYQMVMQTRSRNGEDLILRPKAQIIRRSCHECDKPFIPASRTECENCHHTRCTLCPRYPAKAEKWPMGSPGDEKAPQEDPRMIRAVQRVYKKPRQRVRPKRDMSTHDPTIVQAVADRLAAYLMPAQSSGIAAAG
ncbi:hypothetical protein LTR85_009782 [Meristemomyces frigidus]|nr:hypothetical protein LTR85_009782 [Meristemomyces frigidus]